MVKDRNTPGFRIESNFREIIEPKLNLKNTLNFEQRVPRKDKDYTNTLSESRFEIINKTPDIMTSVPRVPGFDMSDYTGRKPHLFGKTETGNFAEAKMIAVANTECGAFYDAKVAITKPRLDAGVPKMSSI